MFDWFADPNAWVSLFTLTVLEIVLGVDNIIFISILAGKLPPEQQARARTIGLALALITRVLLLSLLFWLTSMTAWKLFPLPFVMNHETHLPHEVSLRDLVLIVGGFFLLWKSTREIHHSLEGVDQEKSSEVRGAFGSVLVQIVLIDVVFSLDSVITAAGMVRELSVMIIAVVVAIVLMMFAAKPIGDFVNGHPTIKMLALSFLIMIGFVLVLEGCGQHVPKGYIYTSMAFAFGVEMLNMRARKKAVPKPVELRREY